MPFQRGAAAVIFAVMVFQPVQAVFNRFKIGGIYRVLGLGRQQRIDFFLSLQNSVFGLGMGFKRPGQSVLFVLFETFNSLEKRSQRLWVVARLVHVLNRQVVRFQLKLSRKLEESERL